MKRKQKWALGLGITAAVLGAAWLAVAWWLPTDEEFAARLTAKAEERLGVRVTIGSAHWALLPRPVVVVTDFRTRQARPVVIGQLTAHLKVRALLNRKLVFERIDVEDAVFPRNSTLAFSGAPGASEPDAGGGLVLEHFVFRNVTWISYTGIAVIYDGEIDFDANWRPRHAELRRPGISPPFTLTLERDGDADRWQTRIHVGGGTLHGNVALKSAASGAMHLSGQLTPIDIEVASAVSSFNRRSAVGGKGSGQTVLSAVGKTVGELARSLHTRTVFSVNPATILRFDLEKAISTLGKEHAGQTALQELTGQMDTQNTDEGMRTTYTGLKARAGERNATGEATVYHRQLEASGILHLVAGGIGVPFTVSGPVAKPKASVSKASFVAATIGAAVQPRTGTGIDARTGDAPDQTVDGGEQRPVAAAPIPTKEN
jgi:hypothetical protein